MAAQHPRQLTITPKLSIDRSNSVLEWDRLIELTQKEASSLPAKEKLKSLLDPNDWANSTFEANQLQHETLEVTALLDREGLWGPLVDLSDPSEIFSRLEKSAILTLEDLVCLRGWLYAMDSWVQTPRDEIRGESFKKMLTGLFEPSQPLRVLDRILTPEGELSERASPKLAGINSEIRALKQEIGRTLDSVIKNLHQKGVLQEDFFDVRDGRFVVPVKISSQGEVDGTLYEASVSRQTVFVEPREVSALNNRLRQKENDLLQEIHTILREVVKVLAPFVQEMRTAVDTLVYWDQVHAKAKLGRHYSGKMIQVTDEKTLRLNQTAHPLLWWSMPVENIVRNDVEFEVPAKALLLTGPNTGGKTVLLKTLGLAGICARNGFPFPATDHPIVPFYERFFADLGDSQSIEHHVSSFSGHVLQFKEILDHLSDRSLVLLDELNSATDPEEGAAFGRAILETLMTRGAMIVATTHDPHLKALALSDTRLINASMAFDESARIPTYRMLIGVPGRSRALETAERLGISPEIIQLARSYLSEEHASFEKLLGKLQSDVNSAEVARKEAFRMREEAERLKTEWTEKASHSVQDIMDRSRSKLKRILEQAQDEVRIAVRRLDETRSRKEIQDARLQLNETLEAAGRQFESVLKEEVPEELRPAKVTHSTPVHTAQIEPGAKVRVPKWKSIGTVLEISDSKVKVALGTLQVQLGLQEVELVEDRLAAARRARASVQVQGGAEDAGALETLDLRGFRFEEAMSQLEAFLDVHYRSGRYVEVTVVHGLGTGALREGTLKLLKSLPYVRSFRDGGKGHGGAGATIVEFDRDS